MTLVARVAALAVLVLLTVLGPEAKAQGPSLADMKPMKLRVNALFGPDNPFTRPMVEFAKRIEQRTAGKVSFEYFYAGALVPIREAASGLGSGLFDFGFVVLSFEPAKFTVDGWQSKFAIPVEPNLLRETVLAGLAGWEWTSEMAAHDKQLKDAGIFPIISSLSTTGPYGILCKQDNTTLASVAGKRVRVGGQAWVNEAQNLGMTPVTIPITEAYQAFQSGVIDCWIGAPQDAGTLGFYDHAKYFNFAGLTAFAQTPAGFNLEVWKSFPQEVKDIVWDETPRFAAEMLFSTLGEQVAMAKKFTSVNFVVPNAEMKKKIDDHHEQVRVDAIATAPSLVANPAAEIAKLAQLKAKWNKMLSEELGFGGSFSWADFRANGQLPNPNPLIERIKTEIVSKVRAKK